MCSSGLRFSKGEVLHVLPRYKELMHARKDVSHLSVRDLMLLDTKVVCLRGLNAAWKHAAGLLVTGFGCGAFFASLWKQRLPLPASSARFKKFVPKRVKHLPLWKQPKSWQGTAATRPGSGSGTGLTSRFCVLRQAVVLLFSKAPKS